jgi:putative transposase
MYSYEDRTKAVRLYIEFDQQMSRVIKKLGYPSRRALRDWYQELLEAGDLHTTYPERSPYSDQDRQRAVDHFSAHGENISRTISRLGYPSRDSLRMWIDELSPGMRKAPVQSGRSDTFSEEEKRAAVVELCAREKSAAAVAESLGVSRVTLYKWKNELLGTDGRPRVQEPRADGRPDNRDELDRKVESIRKRIHRLQLEHDILKGTNELLKKDQGIDPQSLTNREKTLLVDALSATYKASELLEQPEKYAELRRSITEIFRANNKCYGYRRVHVEVKRFGLTISEKVIRRVMAEEGLTVASSRRRRYSSYNGEVSPAVENLLKRDFHADAPTRSGSPTSRNFRFQPAKPTCHRSSTASTAWS